MYWENLISLITGRKSRWQYGRERRQHVRVLPAAPNLSQGLERGSLSQEKRGNQRKTAILRVNGSKLRGITAGLRTVDRMNHAC
jgi:hypothetical protein